MKNKKLLIDLDEKFAELDRILSEFEDKNFMYYGRNGQPIEPENNPLVEWDTDLGDWRKVNGK